MRAVVVRRHGPPEAHALEEVPTPPLRRGAALLRVHAIGVNFPDLLVIRNRYQYEPPLPFIPGKEVAGTVAAVGPGVTELAVGDRVLALVEHGGYAEEIVVPTGLCHRIPPGIDFTHAAAMGDAFQTAYFALVERAQLGPGESVLVTGASGGVGQAMVQLARARGARVLAGIRSRDHEALARANGADHVVDLGAPSLRDALRAQVRAVTDGRGVDVALDQVGGDVFDASLRAMAWCGRLVVVGFAGGRIPEVKANYLLVKNIAVVGFQWSDYRDRFPARVQQVQQELFALAAAATIGVRRIEEHSLEDFVTAMQRFEGRLARGKVVLRTRATP
jgi:NADPH2:quinone reductase